MPIPYLRCPKSFACPYWRKRLCGLPTSRLHRDRAADKGTVTVSPVRNWRYPCALAPRMIEVAARCLTSLVDDSERVTSS